MSISLSGTEVKEFDNITNKKGFSSRSDAVREALPVIHDFKNILKAATHTHFGDRCGVEGVRLSL